MPAAPPGPAAPPPVWQQTGGFSPTSRGFPLTSNTLAIKLVYVVHSISTFVPIQDAEPHETKAPARNDAVACLWPHLREGRRTFDTVTIVSSYLLILAEREAVAWVLRESRMAFPPTRRSEVSRLAVGDELFILTTRGCWHNPTRDRTRVIGRATVGTSVVAYDEPVIIAGRDFTRGCDITITSLAPYLAGVDLVPLVPQLGAFPDKRAGAWSIRLRRPLLEIPSTDAQLLTVELSSVAVHPADTIPHYLVSIRPVRAINR